MTDIRKEIDLLINAQFRGRNELAAVPKTIAALEAALDKQTKAAQRGEASIDELKSTLLSLEQVKSTIAGGAGLIGSFQKLTAQIEKSEASVRKNAQAYDEYKKNLGDIAQATDQQRDKLQKLAAASDRSLATLTRQRAEYTAIEKSLKEAGVSTNDLANAEKNLLDQAAKLGVVMSRNRDAIKGYGDTVAKAREETRKLAEAEKLAAAQAAETARAREKAAEAQRAASAGQLRQSLDNKDSDAATRASQLAALRADITGRSRDAGLSKTADDADKAAKSFTTLARASSNLTPKVVSLREAVSSIISPTDEANKTIGGIETRISSLSNSFTKAKGPIKDYQTSMSQLKAAQAALGQQASLIDDFSRQTAALRAARAEFTQARAQVIQYAAAVRQGGDEGARFTKALADAQARAGASSAALAQQVAATRQVRDALRAAGLATNDLVASQARLNSSASASVAAMRQLGDATERYGVQQEKASSGERTTLNFAQRLRGQILSLTAAYVGLFGAVQTANSAIKATVDQDAINNRLAVAIDSNDADKIAKEYTYLRNRADYYGVGVKSLADSYGGYAIAAKSAGFQNDQTKFTFEQLTAGMRVLKLSTDQQGRAFTQLQQILSKTKPEMEDIKTIAESGFVGVQGLMARGLLSIGQTGVRAGTEVQDMFKLMKEGALDSGTAIFALAVQSEKELGKRIPEAIKSLSAEQGRFESQVFDFQKAIADSGWADAYKQVLIDLSVLIKSEDGARAAQAIGQAFSALAKTLIFLLSNIELVKAAAQAFIVIWAGNTFIGAIQGLMALSVAATAAGGAFGLARGAFILFATALAAWNIGKWANDQFTEVRQAGIYLVTSLDIAWTTIRHSFQAAFEVLPIFFQNVLATLLNSLTFFSRKVGSVLASLASAVGFDEVANALNTAVKDLTFETKSVDSVIAARKKSLEADLAAIKKIRDDSIEFEFSGGRASTPAASASGPTPQPGRPRSNLGPDDKKAEAAAKQRLADIAEITKALENLSTKTSKAQGESLKSQLDAVDTQYAELGRKIAALGGQQGIEFTKQFSDGIKAYKGEITANFNAKLLAEQQSLQKKIEDAEVASGRRSATNLDARLAAIKTKYAQTYREIEDYRAKLESNGQSTAGADQMKQRLDGEVETIKNLERQKFAYDELKRFEGDMQQLLQTRAASLRTIADLEEASIITTAQARSDSAKVIATMQPQIEALALEAQNFAISLGAAFDPIKIQQFIAQLTLAKTSAKGLNTELVITEKQFNEKLAAGITNVFGTFADNISQAIAGQKSWGDAIKATGRAFLQFAADFLREIAMMILKQLVLKALQSSGAFGGLFSAGAGVAHAGGVIGHTRNRTRQVSPGWFANAPRYHSGGMAGLGQDEYATILQRGEEVLTKDSPRNIMNGGSAQSGKKDPGTRFVLVDDRSKVAEAMASAEGDRVIIESIRRNAATVRQYTR